MSFDICFLIIAHKNASQIDRLCAALTHDKCCCVLHIDKKSSITDSEVKWLKSRHNNLFVLSERFSNHLDDWSLVRTTLALCRYVTDHDLCSENGHVALLSAQDYPIKPIDSLLEFLTENPHKAYIDCTPYSSTNWVGYKIRHNALFGKYYGKANAIKCKWVRRGLKLLLRLQTRLAPQRYVMRERLKENNIEVYGGSAWWILSLSHVKAVLEKTREHKLMRLLEGILTPEETFFQTVLIMTQWRDDIELNDADAVAQNCLTFANFTPPGKEFCGHPYIITRHDWSWLKYKPHYFARKFDMEIDEEIFDKIDQDIKL